MPRLLELFSGTGSVGNGFRQRGWEVVSLDLDAKAPADIHADVLQWDATVYPPGHFDAVWASPPCENYSIARTWAKTPRNLDLADSLVRRTLELIEYFQPRAWWMENPWTGLLRKRPVVQDLPFAVVDYCAYGRAYKKRTALWGNVPFRGRLCDKACSGWDGRGHRENAQRGSGHSRGVRGRPLSYLHALPEALIDDIEAATRAHITEQDPPPS